MDHPERAKVFFPTGKTKMATKINGRQNVDFQRKTWQILVWWKASQHKEKFSVFTPRNKFAASFRECTNLFFVPWSVFSLIFWSVSSLWTHSKVWTEEESFLLKLFNETNSVGDVCFLRMLWYIHSPVDLSRMTRSWSQSNQEKPAFMFDERCSQRRPKDARVQKIFTPVPDINASTGRQRHETLARRWRIPFNWCKRSALFSERKQAHWHELVRKGKLLNPKRTKKKLHNVSPWRHSKHCRNTQR